MAVTFTESFQHFTILYNQMEGRMAQIQNANVTPITKDAELKTRLTRLKTNLQQLESGIYRNQVIAANPPSFYTETDRSFPCVELRTVIKNGQKCTEC
ncbi:hypothetical protein SNE40_003031 [Patella caerulea]|uniref:Uncharacterized protein n=1 Tax=Patella caerulea TaxID=87958 RepID=A0AAN8K8W6_PATCE